MKFIKILLIIALLVIFSGISFGTGTITSGDKVIYLLDDVVLLDNDEPILSLSYVEWYTTTEEVAGGFTFGFLHLKIAGFVNSSINRVTVITWGDGLLNEYELALLQPKCKGCNWKLFNDDVEIAFTHKAHNKPLRYKTVVTAYCGDSIEIINLQSNFLTYLK